MKWHAIGRCVTPPPSRFVIKDWAKRGASEERGGNELPLLVGFAAFTRAARTARRPLLFEQQIRH